MRGQVMVVKANGGRMMYIAQLGLYVSAKKVSDVWILTIYQVDMSVLIGSSIRSYKEIYESACLFTSVFDLPEEMSQFFKDHAKARKEADKQIVANIEARKASDESLGGSIVLPTEEMRRLRALMPSVAEQVHGLLAKIGGLQ